MLLDEITHIERAPNFLGRNVPAFELYARRFGRDEQVRKAAKRVDDVFGDAVGEEILAGIRRQVFERQHCYRRALGQTCRDGERRDNWRRYCRSRRGLTRGQIEDPNNKAGGDSEPGNRDGDQPAPTGKQSRRLGGRRSDSVNPHRIGDILDPMPAQWPVIEIELVLYLLVDRVRQADPARSREGLQTGRDIDAVAVKIVVVGNDDIAEIDPDAHLEMTVGRRRRVQVAGGLLHLGGAGKRIDDAAKIGEQPVTGGRDDAPRMAGDHWIDRAAQPLQRVIRRGLVLAHQSAVADDIRKQYRRKLALMGAGSAVCRGRRGHLAHRSQRLLGNSL
jgi:hypothetical protein